MGSGDPSNLAISNNILFFEADDGLTGHALWKLGEATGISFFQFSGRIDIFPNPAVNTLYVWIQKQEAELLTATISDLFGKALAVLKSTSDHIEFDIRRFAAGIYHLTVKDEQGHRFTSGFVTQEKQGKFDRQNPSSSLDCESKI